MAMPSMWVRVWVGVIQAKWVRRKSGAAMRKPMRSSGEHPGRAENADDGSPEEVVLLLDGERPCGADGGRKRDVKEILEEEDVGPPGRGSEGLGERAGR